jgi:KaiC/GvpD/RAD55 family RecA-like ATPase
MKLGVKVIDDVIDIPEGSSILILGATGSGKSFLVKEIAKNFLYQGKAVIYFSYEENPIKVFNSFKENSKLKVVNMFSSLVISDKVIAGKRIIEDLPGLIEKSSLVVIDSLNELCIERDVTQIVKTVKDIIAISYQNSSMLIATYNTGSQETDKVIDMIKYLFDGIIELGIQPSYPVDVRGIRIARMRGRKYISGWRYFSYNERGEMEVVEPEKLQRRS